jgi:hypothetical protein
MAYQQEVIVLALNWAKQLLATQGLYPSWIWWHWCEERGRTTAAGHFYYHFQPKTETKDDDQTQQTYINNRMYGKEASKVTCSHVCNI